MLSYRKRSKRLRNSLIDNVPLALLTNAHEMALAIALVIVSLPLLFSGTHQESWTTSSIWAVLLFAAGAATVVGVGKRMPRVEWTGQLLMGWTLAFFSATLLAEGEFGRMPVWIMLSAVCFWRAFKISNAPRVQARLQRESLAIARFHAPAIKYGKYEEGE